MQLSYATNNGFQGTANDTIGGTFMSQYSNNVIIMSIIIPLIANIFSKLSEKTLEFIIATITISCSIVESTFKRIFKQNKIAEYNGIVINVTGSSPKYGYFSDNNDENISDHALPILWWLSQNCNFVLTKMITSNIDIQTGKIARSYYGTSAGRDISTFIPIPITSTKRNNTPSGDNKEKEPATGPDFKLNPRNIHMTEVGDLLVDDNDSIEISENIYCKLVPCINLMAADGKNGGQSPKESMILLLKSKKSTKYIQDFIVDITAKYYNHVKENQKLTHALLIYMSLEKELSLYTEHRFDKSQTFDHIFFENKRQIINMIDKLNDPEYFIKNGKKRKVSMLFVGPPGSCKTSTALAIANYTNRVLIQVPISRIKYSREVEKILYSHEYNKYDIPNDKKIILFDEIDTIDFTLKKKHENNILMAADYSDNNSSGNPTASSSSTYDKFSPNDDFNIGSFLSLLDGANDQDGMIIIATANDVSKFDSSLYRPGRLTKIIFDYMGREQIVEMLEKYYQMDLTRTQKDKIRDDKIIFSDTLKNMCMEYVDQGKTIDQYIEKLATLVPAV